MNKKFFAALASATMALSATGSLAVFADDFDTVEETNNWVSGNVTVNPDGSVVLNDTNFPDDTFRKAIGEALDVKEGKAISKDKLESVTGITINEQSVIVSVNGKDKPAVSLDDKADVESIEGISAFTNLVSFTSTSNVIDSIDLSKNEKLGDVNITDATDLDELALPATNALKTLVLQGNSNTDRCPLPILDLSGNKGLNTVTINNTDVAMLDLSNNTFLTSLNLNDNKLNKINLEGALNITTLLADNNNLYSLTLPAYSNLNKLSARNNKLNSIDVTKQLKLEQLVIPGNNLKALDLSENKVLNRLVCYDNNLGYLDLSKTQVAPVAYDKDNIPNANTDESIINPQHTYVDEDFDSVDLAANFEGFNKDNVVKSQSPAVDGTVLSFDENANTATYVYNTNSAKGNQNLRVYVLKANLMNRLYNPNSGEHFYTKDANEKDVLVGLGWHDEGIGWVAPTKKMGEKPVYRLYNPNAGDHHYTTDSRERDALVSAGWKSEGIGWYSAKDYTSFDAVVTTYAGGQVGHLDLFREYNPNAKAAGSHNYTLDEAENDFLCSIGWIPEGKAWKGLK